MSSKADSILRFFCIIMSSKDDSLERLFFRLGGLTGFVKSDSMLESDGAVADGAPCDVDGASTFSVAFSAIMAA